MQSLKTGSRFSGRANRSRRRFARRRGVALYLAVLLTSLLVGLLGLSALTVVRVERRNAEGGRELLEARWHARSAAELALRAIENDGQWRTRYVSGVETAPLALSSPARGTLSWMLQDTDGNLVNADQELRLKGTGRVGNAVQSTSVKLQLGRKKLDVLQKTLYCAGSIWNSSSSVVTGAPLATADSFLNTGSMVGSVEARIAATNFWWSSIQGNVWSPSINNLGSIAGSLESTPVPQRNMPPASVFDSVYLPLATTINFSSLPGDEISKVVLSAGNNPYGSKNARGIYHVRVPANDKLTIKLARVNACLLVTLDSNAKLELTSSNFLHPPSADYAVLIVKGSSGATIEFKGSSKDLTEQDASTNLNPSHTPYLGQSDTDQTDKYPSEVRGLVHIIGPPTEVTMKSNFRAQGVILCEGSATLSGNTTLTFDASIFNYRPLGYEDPIGGLRPVAGTWLWEGN